MELSKDCKITQVITPTNGAAATTDISVNGGGATVLDMAGFDSATFIVTTGAITSGAVTSIKAQQGAVSNLSDAADIEGSAQTIADSDDEKVFYIDVHRVTERYLGLYVDRGTQNAVISSAIAVQYGARKVPTTHGTNVSGETIVGPAEGTA